MPAHIGVLSNFGLAAPAGGHVHETSREGSVEISIYSIDGQKLVANMQTAPLINIGK